MKKMEIWFSVILIGVGIAGLIYSISLPLMGPAALCPGLFPGSVTALMVVLGTVRLMQLLRSRPVPAEVVAGAQNAEAESGEGEDGKEEGSRNILVIMALFILYLVLLVYVQFLISTILFLVGTMIFLYRKFLWKIPVISIVTAFGVYYLFRYLLNVRLP